MFHILVVEDDAKLRSCSARYSPTMVIWRFRQKAAKKHYLF